MTGRLRAEWHKLTTIGTFWILLAGAAAVAAIGAVSTTSAATEPPWDMTTPLHEQMFWVLATINGGIFALITGARTFTDEFRHHTIAHTYVADPRRTTSILAKAGAAALAGMLVGVLIAAALLLVAVVMALLSGGEVAVHGSDLGPTVGLTAAMGLWAVVGAGLGAVIRSQVAVVTGGLVWILILENLGAGFLQEAGRYLPGQVVQAMARTRDAVDLLPAGAAAALMGLYALLFVAVALGVSRRRDITA